MVDVKKEFIENLDKPEIGGGEEGGHNPWQSSRPSIPRDDPSENSHDSVPVQIASRSSRKVIVPPPPPTQPPPIQPPSSLDSHYVHQRDLSESIQDDENEIEDMIFDCEYDQILQKPRTSRASSRASFRGRASRGPSLHTLTQHQKTTVIMHSNDKEEEEEKDSENTDSDSFDTHTPSETTGTTNSDQQIQDSPETDDTTIIYNNSNANGPQYQYNKVIEIVKK